MGKIKITDAAYKNFGKCKIISNGLLEMYITADIGPRIIKLNLNGKKNLMFNDIGREMYADVSSAFGNGKIWYIYGGHRLWLSPEEMPHTYYPDNEPVNVRIDGNTAHFTPPPQKINGLSHSIEIEMCEDRPRAKITHRIANIGEKEITGAIWAMSVVGPGGAVICPMPDEDTGLLGNRLMALWPYTRLTDSRAGFFDRYILLKQNINTDEKFKFGINNTKGWLAYQNHGQIFKKTYAPAHPEGIYPDGGMSAEVFCNRLFSEVETLSELKTVKKGEFISHVENWELWEAPDLDFGGGQEKLEEYIKINKITGE